MKMGFSMRTSYWPLVNAKGKVNLECFSYLSVIICNVGNIIRAPISSFALDCLTEFHPVLGNYREQRKIIINHDVNLAKSKFLMFHHAWRNILLLTAFRACLSSSLILECPVIEATIKFIEQRKSKQWSI